VYSIRPSNPRSMASPDSAYRVYTSNCVWTVSRNPFKPCGSLSLTRSSPGFRSIAEAQSKPAEIHFWSVFFGRIILGRPKRTLFSVSCVLRPLLLPFRRSTASARRIRECKPSSNIQSRTALLGQDRPLGKRPKDCLPDHQRPS
jgi:hypothetical protein